MTNPKHVKDEQLLELILSGDLNIDLETNVLTLFERSPKAFLAGKANQQRYYFGLYIKGKRRTIARAKLVYMVAHQRVIPDGFQIHHMDEDHLNDHFNNLIMVLEHDHDKIHGRIGPRLVLCLGRRN